VIVDFRATNPNAGVRPALVIQNDRDNARMQNTLVAQVTTNTKRSAADTQLPIDEHHGDWKLSGLFRASVVNCSNIYTIDQRDVAKVIGSLSQETREEIDDCLRNALGL
jgi:mRNA-degrading endonuclease toxin of MazEF toxin-antitoxin module